MSFENQGEAIEARGDAVEKDLPGVAMEIRIDENGMPMSVHMSPIGNPRPTPEEAMTAVIYAAGAIVKKMGIEKEIIDEAFGFVAENVEMSADITTSKGN